MAQTAETKKGQSCIQAKSMYTNIRHTTQLFGIILAALLLGMGIYYFNILFVIAALAAAFFAGRVFCGWICPNGAWLDHVIRRISPNRKMPGFLTSPWFGYGFTVVFLAVFIYLRVFVTDAPWTWTIPIGMMAVQMTLGTIVGAMYYPRGFCAHVCPWGVLGKLLGRIAPYQMQIQSNCKSCRTCAATCPLGGILDDAIDRVKETGRPETLSTNCMRCMNCAGACPANAIRFGPAQVEAKGVGEVAEPVKASNAARRQKRATA